MIFRSAELDWAIHVQRMVDPSADPTRTVRGMLQTLGLGELIDPQPEDAAKSTEKT